MFVADEGAQLTMEELGEACRVAHERGRRIYLTLNVLIKPVELVDALMFLGEAVDLGIITEILNIAGRIIGIGEYRPDTSNGRKGIGNFGRYNAELVK